MMSLVSSLHHFELWNEILIHNMEWISNIWFTFLSAELACVWVVLHHVFSYLQVSTLIFDSIS